MGKRQPTINKHTYKTKDRVKRTPLNVARLKKYECQYWCRGNALILKNRKIKQRW